MPELPEITAIADHLRRVAVGTVVRRVDVAALSVLKTFAPAPSELHGAAVTGARRIGKYLILDVDRATGRPAHVVVHLSLGGWLRWSEKLPAAPPRPGGKSPIAMRVHTGPTGQGFDLTEAGTRKRLAVWIVSDLDEVAPLRTLGPDALTVDAQRFALILAGSTAQLKTLLRDQRTIAGIGNAYSDEILHAAGLSPFARARSLDRTQVLSLYRAMVTELDEAVTRSVGRNEATRKAEKRSGMKVHGRAGQPCPVCGDMVREVSLSERNFQYCPTCQTGGRILADRRTSKFLK